MVQNYSLIPFDRFNLPHPVPQIEIILCCDIQCKFKQTNSFLDDESFSLVWKKFDDFIQKTFYSFKTKNLYLDVKILQPYFLNYTDFKSDLQFK
jgi:hypothetical protein